MDKNITTTEAAKALGVSRARIHHFIADGRLPATKFGTVYIIKRSDLAKVPKNRKPGPKPKGKSL